MGWRPGEIWLELEPRWFREVTEGGAALFEANAPSFSGLTVDSLTAALPDGLAQSRRRRAELRRRRETRKTRAAALVIGPAVALTLAAPRLGSASRAAGPLEADPPSQTLRAGPAEVAVVDERPSRTEQAAARYPAVRWRDAKSHGVPFAGSLSNGTQLPTAGPGWITWNPLTDRVPNRPHRLYGNDHVIRTLLGIIAAHHDANPQAPPVVVGDLSFRGGGPMELHRSHQNGLDVDVYYPRRDREHTVPTNAEQVHRRLTQDLVDRFVAAGAQMVFVGYATGVHGPRDVVVPYPNHEDHMHVRFPPPSE
jgi:hypothetical protein